MANLSGRDSHLKGDSTCSDSNTSYDLCVIPALERSSTRHVKGNHCQAEAENTERLRYLGSYTLRVPLEIGKHLGHRPRPHLQLPYRSESYKTHRGLATELSIVSVDFAGVPTSNKQ